MRMVIKVAKDKVKGSVGRLEVNGEALLEAWQLLRIFGHM